MLVLGEDRRACVRAEGMEADNDRPQSGVSRRTLERVLDDCSHMHATALWSPENLRVSSLSLPNCA